ncbi:hypothetical protein BST44_18905 [Mycobacterium scrofulaceum]|uniref:DUF3027 domain-containing protein n=1 Tax=Mycobacterium scrofulaceum TaxID=1783 RepID=A0A1X0KDH5_MYCSC|nr:hypothetical protein BST44_18905 [Mycobacterium scrofulaceum]
MQEGDSVTGPIEESAVATVAEWPEGLAAVLTGAADQARAAVVEFSGADSVGDYLGVSYEDPAAATHRFLAHLPGYQGWQWAVVVAAHPGADHATVSEVVLIPGPTALLAPPWVPWDQRVRPGDLSPGDLLAPAADDPRLVPGYVASGDDQVDEMAAEIGLGRRWVMSAWGRAAAAERWRTGDHGPDSAMARSTKRVCRDCGFFLPLAGALGAMFGVCGNELSADGQVVDRQYGCGAHSDTPAPAGTGSPMYEPFDDGVLDVVEAPPEPAETPESAAEGARPDLSAETEPEVAEPEQDRPEATQPEEPQPEESQAEEPQPEESQAEALRAEEPRSD